MKNSTTKNAMFAFFMMGVCQLANASVLPKDLWHDHLSLSAQKTWQQTRDKNITKQDLDYSCGASSLSTILTYFYQTPKGEAQILQDMDLKDVMASFLDLAKVSQKYGFGAKGVLIDYHTLRQIKIPVIVYLNHKRNDHFSVVRAIDDNNVYLADSSWGNRVLSKSQFEKMWLTQHNQGKVLLILPNNTMQKHINQDFTAIKDTQQLLKATPSLFAFL